MISQQSLVLTNKNTKTTTVGNLQAASLSLCIYNTAKSLSGLSVVLTPDMATLNRLERELTFFRGEDDLPILVFPDREMLPYDHFSPHPDILSERMATLYRLPHLTKGIVLASVQSVMHRLMPRDYLEAHSFVVSKGQTLDAHVFRNHLEKAGYHAVSQVMEPGEYAIRGALLDVFPMGSKHPYRIDLFDDEVDTLRTFDASTQRTVQVIDEVRLLPAHEFRLTDDGINLFRQNWRDKFHGNPLQCSVYEHISKGESAAGVEYYLPLFFDKTQSLLSYLSEQATIFSVGDIYDAGNVFWDEVTERHEQLGHNIRRPILPPADLFFPIETLFAELKNHRNIQLHSDTISGKSYFTNADVQAPPTFLIDRQAEQPFGLLKEWLSTTTSRVLFCAESEGRRDVLEGLLNEASIFPEKTTSWDAFLISDNRIGVALGGLEDGLALPDPDITIITESQIFGYQVKQRRSRKRDAEVVENIVRDLSELKIGAPVVHLDHGVGRYMGLETIDTGSEVSEYLMLVYKDDAKVYVPVTSLHLISRYGGSDGDHAPLHRLGSSQWEKAKRKAREKIHDVAAELLDIYAQREMKQGFPFKLPEKEYNTFAAAFPFEETPDQQCAIGAVIEDMTSTKCMDRLVCGDVGFGKTEVAIRAAFVAALNHKQVILLVPTTLLAEQHLHNFQDRFAKWPVRVEAISRFRSKKEQDTILSDLANGRIDIIIGTHKLLQESVKFKSLGLLIVDEEHRFGVRQKERIKAMRAEVDLLTLTATPIPRTLNMSLSGIRDLSMITTPPARRLSVKTFVREYAKPLIREAVLRETMRGGQVYFLHNEVQTINRMAEELRELLPEARIQIGHGQMHEKELEQIMADFYHQRFNVLLCTTIVESGIDIPTANTMIIHRADKFGLAQLHQLRGRVGRSHHQAYAYMLTPHEAALTSDAKKRLKAISSLEDLGAGFMLATHDLEIRGAGELLGDEQSGHIQELGFSLYTDLLNETVKAMKSGKAIDLQEPINSGVEIDIKSAALIPEDYVPDVHMRLVLYKRIASAKDKTELQDLQAEIIDRFGALPEASATLFHISLLKGIAEPLDIQKIRLSGEGGTIQFGPKPQIDTMKLITIVQQQPEHYQLMGSEKLRFTLPTDSTEKQMQQVGDLLKQLRAVESTAM